LFADGSGEEPNTPGAAPPTGLVDEGDPRTDEDYQAALREHERLQDIAWGRQPRQYRDKWMIGHWADIDHSNVPTLDDLRSRIPGLDGSTPVSKISLDPDEGELVSTLLSIPI
jgi:hypothetical protein